MLKKLSYVSFFGGVLFYVLNFLSYCHIANYAYKWARAPFLGPNEFNINKNRFRKVKYSPIMVLTAKIAIKPL